MKRAESTIQYAIKEEGFCYHTKKCCLRKGSTISKNTHPLQIVESFKDSLISNNLITDKGSHYVCKRNIKTGLLMAYNLHHGRLMKEVSNVTVTINGKAGEDQEIKDSFWLQSTHSADDEFWKNIDRDCCVITKIMEATIDPSFFKRSKDDGFSSIEQFVADALVVSGELQEYRRGIANPTRECDIVDESKNRQIEIVRYLDNKVDDIRYKRKPESEEQALLFEYIDIGFNLVPEGVIKKFTEKEYTDKYTKELAIYMIGSIGQARKKLAVLQSNLEKTKDLIKNDYKKIHFIIHDPLISESFSTFSDGKLKTYPDKECRTNPVKHRLINNYELKKEAKYFVVRKNVFSGDEELLWMTGEDIMGFELISD